MDRIIRTYLGNLDNGLFYTDGGVAYQANIDTVTPREYGDWYWQHYQDYKGSEMSEKLNKCRVEMVEGCESILDIGIGSGEFLESLPLITRKYGYDINPIAQTYLKKNGLWFNPFVHVTHEDTRIDGVTMWDSLEHMKEPSKLLDNVPLGTNLYIATPIFPSLAHVFASKHYKPDEHLYYFTRTGLISYMLKLGFQLQSMNTNEIKAGRECIESFCFKREK